MKRKSLLLLVIVLLVLLLSGCKVKTDDSASRQYFMLNGKTPSEMIDLIGDFVLGVYMPSSDESIMRAIDKLSEVATEEEIEILKSEVGKYDASKRATLSNISINIATPDNTTSRIYKIMVMFTLTLNTSGISQNMFLEFQCNYNGEINSHTLWVNNDR